MVTAGLIAAGLVAGVAVLVVFAADLYERAHRAREWWHGMADATPDPEATAAMAAVPDGTARSRHGGTDPIPAANFLADLPRLPANHRKEQ